ncbi:rhomboid family intramembrane serine protease [Poriferisphaera sp. WC338]|uniref:rhomboid family intramembrane serine protease n=1 Tax=Poriferisphaera sp. WC338 TaxID=3425129 RepID=UPI003D8173DA
MSFENRDYYRKENARYGGMMGGIGGRMAGASVVMWIMGITCVVFILNGILSTATRAAWLAPNNWAAFTVDQGIYGFQIWRWFTYQFVHVGFLHILFNMIVLYFFGPMMERWWGSKRFLAFYLLCGMGGAFMMTVLSWIPGFLHVSGMSPLLGASGSIMGILIGLAVAYPNMVVQLLIPPIPLKLKTLALILLGFTVLTLVVNGANAGGEAAHLGGAVMGFILMCRPRILDWADGVSIGAVTQKGQAIRQEQKQQIQENLDAEVDRILDKVNAHGLQSLTKQEKKTLNKATNTKKNVPR